MSKHTPGPWKNDGRKLITTVGIVISKDKSLGPIAVVSEENAPLVLAAPEMYRVLKAVYEQAGDNNQDIRDVLIPSEVYDLVMQILARIEGEK